MRVHDVVGAGRFAEEPKQVDHDGEDIEHQQQEECQEEYNQLCPPAAAAVEVAVPAAKAADAAPYPCEHCADGAQQRFQFVAHIIYIIGVVT